MGKSGVTKQETRGKQINRELFSYNHVFYQNFVTVIPDKLSRYLVIALCLEEVAISLNEPLRFTFNYLRDKVVTR